jgi:hypothetical protein
MITTKSNATTSESGWDLPFWFAVLSPVLGVLVGFIVLLLFYR